MSTLWPHNPPVPTRRLRRGKGMANMMRARFWSMKIMRELEAELNPPVTVNWDEMSLAERRIKES